MPSVRGLTRDEIADLLVTIRPQSAQERELKRRAQEYVAVRDGARREDAARAPEVAAVRRTYENAKSIAELQRDALMTALPALGDHADLASEIEKVTSGWPEESRLAAHNAEDEIDGLKEARQNALSYALGCHALADKVVSALGEEHPASRELLEAKQLL